MDKNKNTNNSNNITKIIIIFILLILLIALILVAVLRNKNSGSENGWNEAKNVNSPELLTGMKAVTFLEDGTAVENSNVEDWYNYIAQDTSTEEGGTSKWANAKTEDGSLWVWIPRFAYKINDNNTIDIEFLKGNTNKNKDGKDVEKLGYIVHPAFKNGTANNFNNGEWYEEITGIWVSKFEAGYAGVEGTGSNNISKRESSALYNLDFKRTTEHVIEQIAEQDIKNEKMPYPVFVGQAYTYNNIMIGEMFNLSTVLTEDGNPYGLQKNNANSHMMKNSEWGACAYLAHSKYGRNGTKITINNVKCESKSTNNMQSMGAVTGFAGEKIDEDLNNINEGDNLLVDEIKNSYAWYTNKGVLASTTGNIYGIYDLNGGASEYISAYMNTIPDSIKSTYAKDMNIQGKSTPYCTVYYADPQKDNTTLNYEKNKNVIGDAISETSRKGYGYSSWNGETSFYPVSGNPFFLRSGDCTSSGLSGIFSYTSHSGHADSIYGFRCVLINIDK